MVKEVVRVDSEATYRVALNSNHPIFQAHFAGNPVMPGACIAQMIKELSENCLSERFFISIVKNMKFLKVISPVENPEISVQMNYTALDDGKLSVSTVIRDGEDVFSKAILVLKPVKK
jgi:3-hydroxymyristoyl/3-hydroxydecanoyl-(acyl carrier protein) dehydratases